MSFECHESLRFCRGRCSSCSIVCGDNGAVGEGDAGGDAVVRGDDGGVGAKVWRNAILLFRWREDKEVENDVDRAEGHDASYNGDAADERDPRCVRSDSWLCGCVLFFSGGVGGLCQVSNPSLVAQVYWFVRCPLLGGSGESVGREEEAALGVMVKHRSIKGANVFFADGALLLLALHNGDAAIGRGEMNVYAMITTAPGVTRAVAKFLKDELRRAFQFLGRECFDVAKIGNDHGGFTERFPKVAK